MAVVRPASVAYQITVTLEHCEKPPFALHRRAGGANFSNKMESAIE